MNNLFKRGLKDPMGVLEGTNQGQGFTLNLCNPCHTDYNLTPFSLIHRTSRDIVWNVWFYELIVDPLSLIKMFTSQSS